MWVTDWGYMQLVFRKHLQLGDVGHRLGVACTQKTLLAGRCGSQIGGSKQTPGNFKRSTLCCGNHHKCNSLYCDLEELRTGLPKEVTIVFTTAKALKGIRKHWAFQWQLCFDSCQHSRNFVFTHRGWFYHRHWQSTDISQIKYTCYIWVYFPVQNKY